MSYIEGLASKVYLATSGNDGTKGVFAVDDDKIVASANMKNGAYTVAAQPVVPSLITVLATAVGTADTMGTVVILGKLADGAVITETVTPVAGTTVSTVNEFDVITSVTGAGWAIDAGNGNDTIKVGVGSVISGGATFEADTDKIVASANMKVGAYTVAASPEYPTTLTVTATAGDTADTMGTVAIYGVGENDVLINETVVPVAGSAVTTRKKFKTVTSVVGAGWVIDGAEGTNDTIKVGVSAANIPDTHYISALHVLADSVVASQTNVAGYTGAEFSDFTKLLAGSIYPCKCTKIALTSGEAIAYLSKM
jgi:hypothetical protein